MRDPPGWAKSGAHACRSARPQRPAAGPLTSLRSRLRFALWRGPFALRRDPACGRQRNARPGAQLVRLVEQAVRRTPEREVDGGALFGVIERREGLRVLEGGPVVVIDPE